MARITGSIQLDFNTNADIDGAKTIEKTLDACFESFTDILESELEKIGVSVDSPHPFMLFDIDVLKGN